MAASKGVAAASIRGETGQPTKVVKSLRFSIPGDRLAHSAAHIVDMKKRVPPRSRVSATTLGDRVYSGEGSPRPITSLQFTGHVLGRDGSGGVHTKATAVSTKKAPALGGARSLSEGRGCQSVGLFYPHKMHDEWTSNCNQTITKSIISP